MKPLDPIEVARRVFWEWRPDDGSWNDVVARRDARVLRVTRRLTRRNGAATRKEIKDAAMIERSNYGYGTTTDTVSALHRLMRRRLVVELQTREVCYIATGEDTCPLCGGTLR